MNFYRHPDSGQKIVYSIYNFYAKHRLLSDVFALSLLTAIHAFLLAICAALEITFQES